MLYLVFAINVAALTLNVGLLAHDPAPPAPSWRFIAVTLNTLAVLLLWPGVRARLRDPGRRDDEAPPR